MWDYINTYYFELEYKIGFVLTNIITVIGAAVLLTKFPSEKPGAKYWCAWLLKSLAAFVFSVLAAGAWASLVSRSTSMQAGFVLSLLMYSVLFSGFSAETCLVRSSVYFAGYTFMIPISEPLGIWLESIMPYTLTQYATPLTILIMTASSVWFLRHYAYERKSAVHLQFMVLLVCVTVMSSAGEFILRSFNFSGVENFRLYHFSIAAIMWLINLMIYYFFYSVSKASGENQILISMKHKTELELEKYQVTKINYEELRMLRHELKNHDFYMKELLEAGKYEQAKEYLDRNITAGESLLNSFECGNFVVDVILNHAMTMARRSNVEIKPEVLIPKELPWSESEICSLLSNLLDNAIEAAAESGAEKPTVLFRMQPRQEYLFIRVTNPVNGSVSEKRRLSLLTTKADSELHGFGTRVIKRIIEQNNGSISCSMEDGTFITDVMLEIKENEAKD